MQTEPPAPMETDPKPISGHPPELGLASTTMPVPVKQVAPAQSAKPVPGQAPQPTPPDPVIEAFRTELCNYVDKPLTAKSLRQILQVAEAARDLLAVRDPRVRRRSRRGRRMQAGYSMGSGYADCDYDEEEDEDAEGVGIQASDGRMNLDRETFGARILREIVAIIPTVVQANRENPTQIVQAIAAAEKMGMTDLVTSLKLKLQLPAADVPAGAPAPAVAQVPDTDAKGAIWAARLPDSDEYIVGPATLDVVQSLADDDHEIVNTQTGQVYRAVFRAPTQCLPGGSS